MECDYCGAETTDTYLCPNHVNRLRNTLHDLAEAWVDSEVTLARLDKHAPQAGGGHSTKHEQMAFNVNCSDVRHETNAVVRMWAIEAGEGRMPGWLRTTPQQARWLASQARKIGGRDYAGQMLRELEDELKALHRAVDRPADRIPAGQCDVCGRELLAPMHAETALCRFCEVVVDVKAQRQAKVDDALGRRFTAQELVRLVPMIYRVTITERTIERWVRRRVLKANDVGMFLLDDVVRLAGELAARKATALRVVLV